MQKITVYLESYNHQKYLLIMSEAKVIVNKNWKILTTRRPSTSGQSKMQKGIMNKDVGISLEKLK